MNDVASAEVVIATPRLRLRELTDDDAPFILRLLNEPSWLRFIGDRGVRSLDDARGYIANGPRRMYREFGFGLYLVERGDDAVALGMCGLIKRESLADVDIGFAFLPEFWGQGYAHEAAAAMLAHARDRLGLARVVAITNPDNDASGRLLQKLGMTFEGTLQLPGTNDVVKLFATRGRD